MRNSGKTQSVIVNEGPDNTRLIHGSCGARRRIRAQQQNLVLRRGGRAFDHNRRQRMPMLDPASQTLEAVNDLESTVLPGRDPDGQLGGRLGRARSFRVTA